MMRWVEGWKKADPPVWWKQEWSACRVVPAAVDCHTHVREPGLSHKEEWVTAAAAAAAGGVGLVCDMPNTIPPTTSSALLQEKIVLADKQDMVASRFYLGVKEVPSLMQHPRLIGVKVYCDETTGGLVVGPEMVVQALQVWPKVAVHAEARTLEKIRRLLMKAKVPKDHVLYVCHVNGREMLEVCAREFPVRVMKEACIPHLFFVAGEQRVKPALGSEADREALWQAIEAKVIDTIATDHAPHLEEEESFGMPSLDVFYPVLLTEWERRKLPLELLFALVVQNPLRWVGVESWNQWVVIDWEKEQVVTKACLQTKCNWSPFEGKRLKRWPLALIADEH